MHRANTGPGHVTLFQAKSGDTMFVPAEWSRSEEVEALEGYEPAKPMIFASIYPVDAAELEDMYSAVDK